MMDWLRWLFRRGKRSTMLLNMHPADEIVSMVAYKQWLAVATRRGELWLISTDQFSHPDVDTVPQALAQRIR